MTIGLEINCGCLWGERGGTDWKGAQGDFVGWWGMGYTGAYICQIHWIMHFRSAHFAIWYYTSKEKLIRKKIPAITSLCWNFPLLSLFQLLSQHLCLWIKFSASHSYRRTQLPLLGNLELVIVASKLMPLLWHTGFFKFLLMKNGVLLNKAHQVTSAGKKWEAPEMSCLLKETEGHLWVDDVQVCDEYVWNHRLGTPGSQVEGQVSWLRFSKRGRSHGAA